MPRDQSTSGHLWHLNVTRLKGGMRGDVCVWPDGAAAGEQGEGKQRRVVCVSAIESVGGGGGLCWIQLSLLLQQQNPLFVCLSAVSSALPITTADYQSVRRMGG